MLEDDTDPVQVEAMALASDGTAEAESAAEATEATRLAVRSTALGAEIGG